MFHHDQNTTNSYTLALYQGDRTELGVFLEKTRQILQTLAGHAREIEQIIALKFGSSFDTMPKGTRHITLLYHQVRGTNSRYFRL